MEYDWGLYDIQKEFAIRPDGKAPHVPPDHIVSLAQDIVANILNSQGADVYVLAKKFVVPYINDEAEDIIYLKDRIRDLEYELEDAERFYDKEQKERKENAIKILSEVQELEAQVKFNAIKLAKMQEQLDAKDERMQIYKDSIKVLILQYLPNTNSNEEAVLRLFAKISELKI